MHETRISINLEKIAAAINTGLPLSAALTVGLALKVHADWWWAAGLLITLTLINVYYRHIQKTHTLLANFGLVAQLRYLLESIGPEFRQYLYSSDTEERPFNRTIRAEIYRKAKNTDASQAFGSLMDFANDELKLRHSMYPIDKHQLIPFKLRLGQGSTHYELPHPVMISAMSFGALGQRAVRALARGAKQSGIAMNTGEGGYPKYHLMEGCDLIFQMGTAKFGVRNDDGSLNDAALDDLAALPEIKMIEIKLSQGAKPGKGGLLPKEKITKEIAELRRVKMGEDIISPSHHLECTDAASTVAFIQRVQSIAKKPVGIKLCVGNPDELATLIHFFAAEKVYPAYISIDGAEGGTGAAPKSFMDDVGLPLFESLPMVDKMLKTANIRDKIKLFAAGKLVTPSRQVMALCLGADACYTARGFMFSLGCIQALQCNNNTCPVGITTHNTHLQGGLDIAGKAERVANYANCLLHDHAEIRSALGVANYFDLSPAHIRLPYDFPTEEFVN